MDPYYFGQCHLIFVVCGTYQRTHDRLARAESKGDRTDLQYSTVVYVQKYVMSSSRRDAVNE